MSHLDSVHLVGGQLDPKTFSDTEREAIAKALTSGKTPDEAPVSVAFALNHCADMKTAEKKAVAAAMRPATPTKKKKTTKKKTKKG